MGLLDSLQRIPADRYFEIHSARLDQPDAAAIRAAAITRYQQIPDTVLGAEEARRLGALLIMAAKRDLPTQQPATETGAEAIAALSTSLRQQPANPLTWAYLAEAELRFNHDRAAALRALEQSYRVGPFAAELLVYRLGLALQCRREWTPNLVGHLREEIAALFPEPRRWRRYRRQFIHLAHTAPNLDAITRVLLRPHPTALAQYQKDYDRGR
ncbi:hypothetical protein [Marichromatium bheemlicum]|uniref:Uncharacterized protein n=1 Tax=Marichromatium bheemlicum TaxID=365339 RepID=A0ABX1IAJ0_9GAMM|nr:hypothetical protein [Marichromatium bheemlicum]NKN34552.1 hypothetical protein [Marichromatium bheemlicum]